MTAHKLLGKHRKQTGGLVILKGEDLLVKVRGSLMVKTSASGMEAKDICAFQSPTKTSLHIGKEEAEDLNHPEEDIDNDHVENPEYTADNLEDSDIDTSHLPWWLDIYSLPQS